MASLQALSVVIPPVNKLFVWFVMWLFPDLPGGSRPRQCVVYVSSFCSTDCSVCQYVLHPGFFLQVSAFRRSVLYINMTQRL